MNRQMMIDILGDARAALDVGRLDDVLSDINAVRDALLDGDPEEDRED